MSSLVHVQRVYLPAICSDGGWRIASGTVIGDVGAGTLVRLDAPDGLGRSLVFGYATQIAERQDIAAFKARLALGDGRLTGPHRFRLEPYVAPLAEHEWHVRMAHLAPAAGTTVSGSEPARVALALHRLIAHGVLPFAARGWSMAELVDDAAERLGRLGLARGHGWTASSDHHVGRGATRREAVVNLWLDFAGFGPASNTITKRRAA